MQARALRFPELCDDHTPPSCLVAYPLAKLEHRSVNTLVLPDPWRTQGGLVTFLACALHQPFVRSCDLAHHGLYCSHVCACTHHSSLQHLSLVFTFVIFQFSDGRTAEGAAASWHHRVESLLLHGQFALSTTFSPTVTSCASPPLPVQMSASTRESHGAALLCCIPGALHLCKCFPAAPASHPHTISGCRHADYSTHRCLSGHFLRNFRSWGPWLHLLRLTLSALRVLDQSPRYF